MRGQGHCVALGTAGSGKTVMAVHRARYLSRAPAFGGPTLLITFNGTLVTYLRSLVGAEPDITVEQYYLFAKRYLDERGQVRLRICGNEARRALVAVALEEVRGKVDRKRAVLGRPTAFFLDEFDWLAGNGVDDFEDYLGGQLDRTGRGTQLTVADRAVVHHVYRRYKELLAARSYIQDWAGVASELLRALRNERAPRQYRHVIIDEGQDFSPEMIRSLVAAVPEDGSLTFFGDYAQQIYGSRMSWQSLGLRVTGGKVVRFERNYRNTRQIARLAKAISDMPLFPAGVNLVQPKEPAADGTRPALVRAKSKAEQVSQAARFANNLAIDRRTRVADRRVAVLMRTDAFNKQLAEKLDRPRRITRLHKGMETWNRGPGIFYGTYADARGLEFDSVVLPLCDDDELPASESIDAFGIDEATVRQAREVYVAVTRARTELVLLHSQRLTSLLPGEESGLYERVDP